MTREEYIQGSTELNLFWLRIMKEHCIFIGAALMCKDMHTLQRFDRYKVQFEMLLYETVELSGNVGESAGGGAFLTEYTLDAERKTQMLTGLSINSRVTVAEKAALEKPRPYPVGKLPLVYDAVRKINSRADMLTRGLVELQTKTQDAQINGEMFTFNYASAFTHMNDEAARYLQGLERLSLNEAPEQGNCDSLPFWNANMAQHAKTLRGTLDPSEIAMFNRASALADTFTGINAELKDDCAANVAPSPHLLNSTLSAAQAIKRYKSETVKGIFNNRLKITMLPLYADHLLREAAYFINLL